MSAKQPSRTVRINYDEFATGEDKFVHDGRYVPDGVLPFDIEECVHTIFEMDGAEYRIVGDLGGHAVYRQTDGTSTVRTMDWDSFAQLYGEHIITVK